MFIFQVRGWTAVTNTGVRGSLASLRDFAFFKRDFRTLVNILL